MGFLCRWRFSHGRENHGDGLVDVRFLVLRINWWRDGIRLIPKREKCSKYSLDFYPWPSASDGGSLGGGECRWRSSSFSFTVTSNMSPWPKINWFTVTRLSSNKLELCALKVPCGSLLGWLRRRGGLSERRLRSMGKYQRFTNPRRCPSRCFRPPHVPTDGWPGYLSIRSTTGIPGHGGRMLAMGSGTDLM